MSQLQTRRTARMARRPVLSAIVAAIATTMLLAQIAAAAPPTSSGAVSRSTGPFAVAYFDSADGLLALGGPAPEEGCMGAGFDDPALFTEVQTGAGPVVVLVHQAELPLAVYDSTLGHPCDILAGGGTPTPLYVGTVRTVGTDNDVGLVPSLTRTNSFGTSSTGWVEDADGNRCHFSGHVRLQITRQGDFKVASEGITVAC